MIPITIDSTGNPRVLPTGRFVEYETSDLDWMVPLGLAPYLFETQIGQEFVSRSYARCMEAIEQDLLYGASIGQPVGIFNTEG